MSKKSELEDAVNDWEYTIRALDGLPGSENAVDHAKKNLERAKDRLDRYNEGQAKRDADKRMFRPPPGKSFGGRVYEVKK